MDLAEKRREIRRRRILMNSEDRMKKLMGYNNGDVVKSTVEDNASNHNSSVEDQLDSSYETPVLDVSSSDDDDVSRYYVPPPLPSDFSPTQAPIGGTPQEGAELLDSIVSSAFRKLQNSAPENRELSSVERPLSDKKDSVETTRKRYGVNGFYKCRQILCLFLGILIRLSFLTSLGEGYVQTLVYPFVALQITFIGYQRAVQLDLADGFGSGGVVVWALMLAGMKPEMLHTYKTIMAIINIAADDFAVYLFAFICTHVLVEI